MRQGDQLIYFITVILPYILSCITIWMTMLAGNKHKSAWLVGIANQVLWLLWIVTTATWGFLLLNIVLWILYIKNHIQWNAK